MLFPKIVAPLVGLFLIATPVFAEDTSDLQAQITALLAQVKALQAQVAHIGGPSKSSGVCAQFTRNLYSDSTDASTDGQVSKLQQFLASNSSIYPEGLITGFFGPATERAVQRWQAQNSIATSGTPDTTGYGFVGPKTREAMARNCGGQAVQGSPVKDQTYTPTAQASIKVNSSSYTDSIEATYANLPVDSQIWIVDVSTGNPYTGQSTMVGSGGSGSVTIPVPDDLPRDKYILRVSSYYDQSKVFAKSSAFRAGTAAVETSYTQTDITSFTASPSSVTEGESTKFSWKSNLTQDDVSQNGAGCSIEGRLTNNNQAVQVTSTFLGANGSFVYKPLSTATYTLMCTSGGKDGAPTATRQLTVPVTASTAAPSCTLTPSSSGYVSTYAPLFFVKPNSAVTLTWTSQNADYAYVLGEKGDVSGSITVDYLPNVVNNYSVTVHGKGGSATCNSIVTVDWKG